ncbi:hypothetical protein [Neorhodopirellula pilleata]|uniref:Uncharacterized protein n=1 Tax=Neorhodopirellula pilleata TaxID=2714738 RepID=A0A5C6AIP2_9BACT|nr:hypothetical protein [Neorhodopirellula pilleata]TWT98931.1 hypothetical protein Pla100_20970 [Neorhodopirellula pilleata]
MSNRFVAACGGLWCGPNQQVASETLLKSAGPSQGIVDALDCTDALPSHYSMPLLSHYEVRDLQ